MRKRIFEIIEKSEGDDVISTLYDVFMVITIVASLVPLAFKTENQVFKIMDRTCVVIFIIDYLLRLLTADYKYDKKSLVSFIRYPFSLMAIIDLISILPSLTTVNSSLKILRLIRMVRMIRMMRVMRMIRALRVFRVFKAARYSKNIEIILDVLRDSREPLTAVGTLAVVYILISALVIINVEPDSFDNFYDAVYWATVSLTTMGYGDIYPVTAIGRFVTMLSSIFGIAIVALPSGIITAGYMTEMEKIKGESKETDSEDGDAK